MFKLINSVKNKKGFTLIELLVVLAVLAIVALIAVPRFTGIKDSAKLKADYASARTIARAIELASAAGDVTGGTTVICEFSSTNNLKLNDTDLSKYLDSTAKHQSSTNFYFVLGTDGKVLVYNDATGRADTNKIDLTAYAN